jgi:hypothetical protein
MSGTGHDHAAILYLYGAIGIPINAQFPSMESYFAIIYYKLNI